MKCFIFAFAVSGFLTSTKGQCPLNVENISVAKCEGSTKYGPYIYIDFHKINRPCSCTVTTSFIGSVLVISEVIKVKCNTQVMVANSLIFGCPITALSSANLVVEINQSVSVRAEYSVLPTLGTFYHCLGFQQNGGKGGNLSVVCGSQHTEETTTMKMSTSTASTTTPLFRPSSVVSSMELIATSAINKNNSDITISTDTILSEELKCDHRIVTYSHQLFITN